MPFGRLSCRWVEKRAETDAQIALAREQQKRAEALIDFREFLDRQQARVTATLKRSSDRILKARFGDCESDEARMVLSRQGTTVTSGAVERRFQEWA